MLLGTQKQTITDCLGLCICLSLWHKVVFLHISAPALNLQSPQVILSSVREESRSLKNFVLLFHDFFKANRLKVKLGREQQTYILF